MKPPLILVEELTSRGKVEQVSNECQVAPCKAVYD